VKLAVASRALDAAAMQDRILHDVANFTGGSFEDDATLVVVAAV
jgi:serine phosphatase RsbU (regulator of sigma subunit)